MALSGVRNWRCGGLREVETRGEEIASSPLRSSSKQNETSEKAEVPGAVAGSFIERTTTGEVRGGWLTKHPPCS